MHPGITPEQPNEVSLVVVRIRSLLLRAARTQATSSSVVMFDTTNQDEEPHFLGGIDIQVDEIDHTDEHHGHGQHHYTYTPETTMESVRNAGLLLWEESVSIADREWQILVTHPASPAIAFVILGSVIILLACLCLAAWYHTNARRETRMHNMRVVAEAEKAALILENAEKNAAHERELVSPNKQTNSLSQSLSIFILHLILTILIFYVLLIPTFLCIVDMMVLRMTL